LKDCNTNASTDRKPSLALPQSGWLDILKLTCWLCGTDRSTLVRKRARARHIGEAKKIEAALEPPVFSSCLASAEEGDFIKLMTSTINICLALSHTAWSQQYDETGSQFSWNLVQIRQCLVSNRKVNPREAELGVSRDQTAVSVHQVASSLLLSSLEFSDTKVYAPSMRALLETRFQ